MIVEGFKCFNKDMTNKYGVKFLVGNIYICEGIISYGAFGNGFHLCKNIEDTFKYFDALNNEVSVCKVIGSGSISSCYDDYNEDYSLFAVEKLEIEKKLTREEIIDIGLKLDLHRAIMFVSSFNLTKEEISLFKNQFNDFEFNEIIDYYQSPKTKKTLLKSFLK